MATELSYVLINPHTIHKSRTGGVITRLLTRTGCDLVAAQMFAPSQELINAYTQNLVTDKDPQDRKIQQLIVDYIKTNYAPDAKTGQRRRVMMLLFKGEDAVRKTRAVVGNITHQSAGGETIRDTYGDYVTADDGTVQYFEPAVLAAPSADDALAKLQLWAKHADTDGGLLDNVLPNSGNTDHQRTLVLIKPDNFKFPSGRPGNVIDMFSRTGLAITAIKVHRMSVAEAEEFYAPVRPLLREKMGESAAAKSRDLLESALGLQLTIAHEGKLAELLGPLAGEHQFKNIVRFMSGRTSDDCSGDQRLQPGTETCIALVYEGRDAVRKIREVLGPTDPSKAPPGSIRREFGQTVMVNAAHASDSPENAKRELEIVKIRQNNLKSLVETFYRK